MKKYVIIVAGGSGSRMGAEIPKQFLLLRGIPILFHTIYCFDTFEEDLSIIVTIPEEQFDLFFELKEKYQLNVNIQLVKGGKSRYHSVSNAIKTIKEKDVVVAIHDGVRPFIKHKTIKESYATAIKHGTAITSVSLKDSIRKKKGSESISVSRDDYLLVQTPQTFVLDKVIKGYGMEKEGNFTDDASVAESLGEKICLINGDYFNIKITTPEDLIIADSIAEQWTC